MSREQIKDAVVKILANDDRVVFAYLYGSIISDGNGNDIDVAVFQKSQADVYSLAIDTVVKA